MDGDVTVIAKAVIDLVVAVLGVFLIPYIKSKYSEAQIKNAMGWVKIAVEAAEQIYKSDAGKIKKKYVKKFLEDKGIKMDEKELDNAIESAVLELHSELYGKGSQDVAENDSDTAKA